MNRGATLPSLPGGPGNGYTGQQAISKLVGNLRNAGWSINNYYRDEATNDAIYQRKGIPKPYTGASRHSSWEAVDVWNPNTAARAALVARINSTPGYYAEDEGDHVHIQTKGRW